MSVDRTRRVWLQGLNTHVRALHAHEVAAALSARIGDTTRAMIESQNAFGERIAYADRAAKHPEWSADAAVGLVRGYKSLSMGQDDGDD